MLGSTFLPNRQHAGLQKLSALAAIAHSSLGPNKKYNFIQDDTSGESALVCSCFRVFENLQLTCAVGQLVYETLQAHQKVYHTGSGCLLFLAGAWSRAALECLHKGISVAHIVSAMSEGMAVCSDVCRKSSISVESLCVAKSHGLGLHLSEKPVVEASLASCHTRGTTRAAHKTLNGSGLRKIKLSRHFCEAKSENVSTAPQPTHPDITRIAEGLSHGCVDAMNLVLEASRMQSECDQQDISCSTFDVSKVVTCVIPGLPEERACVLPGCVVPLSAEQALVAHHLKEQQLKVALITGDLSDTYRHLGFNRPAGIQCVSDHPDSSGSSKEDEWMEKFSALLSKLEVNLILVSGVVSERVILRCCRHRVLVVEKVKVSILKAFADSTGAVPVTYAKQLSKHCVGSGATVEMRNDLSSRDRKVSATVNISTGENSELVTAILTSCVHGKLRALEDQFWACAYRLHHMLKDRVLLRGAGVTEMLCVHHLQKQASHHLRHHRGHVQHTKTATTANPYSGVVLHLMADGLIDYISTLMVNTGRFSKVSARTAVNQQLQDCKGSVDIAGKFSQLFLEGEQDDSAVSSSMKYSEATAAEIYDNLSVKQEAWRKALDLVFLILQADAEIITGTDQKTDAGLENLILL